ncbi:MAG TPA: hypothetical protein ENH82_04110 [bacterium]|nr:hypothetical protein [bacterium]
MTMESDVDEISFTDKAGRAITLRLMDEYYHIAAFFVDDMIGGIHFRTIGDDDPFMQSEGLKVTNMYLDKLPDFTRCGIGTAIVELAEELSGLKVAFGHDDGSVADDGSHLTGVGPAFANHIYSRR